LDDHDYSPDPMDKIVAEQLIIIIELIHLNKSFYEALFFNSAGHLSCFYRLWNAITRNYHSFRFDYEEWPV